MKYQKKNETPYGKNPRAVGAKRPRKSSEVDTRLFVKKALPMQEVVYENVRKIIDLPVDQRIIKNLVKKGYVLPTEIQDRTLEPVLNGRDVLGLAQTGTGKTGAFLVPLIHQLVDQKPDFQVLIVTPTRELALQITDEFRTFTTGLKMFSTCLIGGTSVHNDVQHLRRPSHFIIGTPGRICDLVRQGMVNLNSFSVLVLDEFDRLLDMGFSKEVDFIIEGMTRKKQTLLFSATEDKAQRKAMDKLLNNPIEIRIRQGNQCADFIDQDIVRVKDGERKMDVLVKMVSDESFEKVLVFAETKRWVSKVCKVLKNAGLRVDEIHGNKTQNYRIQALNRFREQKIKILVATDVAARGLDITDISHVINFHAPLSYESYIHRIGRTGRAGKGGKALTFIN